MFICPHFQAQQFASPHVDVWSHISVIRPRFYTGVSPQETPVTNPGYYFSWDPTAVGLAIFWITTLFHFYCLWLKFCSQIFISS